MIRRRLLAYGVCTVAAYGVVSFLTIITIDWLFHLPAALRTLGSVLFVLGGALATLHWVVRPLRARLGIDEIAGRIEQHFSGLRDQLVSAINFCERRPGEPRASARAESHGEPHFPASVALTEQVIAETDEAVRGLRIESQTRPARVDRSRPR